MDKKINGEMKHLKEYDGYSDDDLEGLIGDLSDIGHQHKFIEGKDFGFGPDLKGKNDGKSILFFTPFATEKIKQSDLVTDRDERIFKANFFAGGEKIHSIIIKSEQILSLHYPPTRTYLESYIGNNPPVKGMYAIALSSYTGREREFPINTSFLSRNAFLSQQKVKHVYNDLVEKIKSIKF